MKILEEKYKIKSGVRGSHFGITGQKVKELRKLGMTYKQIKQIVGCSLGTISYWLSDKTTVPKETCPPPPQESKP